MENEKKSFENKLGGIERLSENEKLELFKVEELETRLEMAALATGSGGGGGVGNAVCGTEPDGVCW